MNAKLSASRRGRVNQVAAAAAGDLPTFTNNAALVAAGYTAAKCKHKLAYLSAGGTGSVPCLAFSDGTTWKQVAIGANCI